MISTEIQEQLEAALQAHKLRQYEQAEQGYQRILKLHGQHLDAMQLLAALWIENGRCEPAIELLKQTLAIQPSATQCWINLAIALNRTGRVQEAISAYESCLRLDGQDFESLKNVGALYLKTKQTTQAVDRLQSAFRLRPDRVDVGVLAATALYYADRCTESYSLVHGILQKNPQLVPALKLCGQLLLKHRVNAELGVTCWRRLIELEGETAIYLSNLGSALKQAKQFEQAIEACQKALTHLPGFYPALCNLGLTLACLDRIDQSIEVLRQALSVEDRWRASGGQSAEFQHKEYQQFTAEKWNELAPVVLTQLAALANVLGQTDEAQRLVDLCLQRKPDHAEAQLMQGFLYLQAGEFEKGWPLYEWRRSNEGGPRKVDAPEWDGRTIDGAILVHAEQGLGDTIQFVRYLSLVKQRVGKLIFLAQKPLVPLLRSCAAIDELVSEGQPHSAFDCHVPLLTLPKLFDTRIDSVPADVPYLSVPPELIEQWRQRLACLDGFRIGIAWQGNAEFSFDSLRRLKLDYFRNLSHKPHVRLISLQKGPGADQLKEIDFDVTVFEDLDDRSGPFMDTAAVMCNVDLIISPCTSIAHLAGALNRPLWFARSLAAEWRWRAGTETRNPWYPSMRVFTQSVLRDWTDVFRDMESELDSILHRSFGLDRSNRPELRS